MLGATPQSGLPAAKVVAAGRLSGWFDKQITEVRHESGRIQLNDGIPGRGERIYRYLVEGREGQAIGLKYQAEKAKTIERAIELRETPKRP